jgi:hypothetical protein
VKARQAKGKTKQNRLKKTKGNKDKDNESLKQTQTCLLSQVEA